ncbi:hypothetical protein AURDEDRAFT_117910 [Auricularia subglabra TFB-10046 SS5]|uniref:Uncharacterized protein n=1 Tax=Auricularia subglabra (strain TFB-10046 / SS5) TaxID=717982 RepID=J0LA47_AURST|nr:hypothetical protein AURDEDRAFT_117910 [Auricularia subglabra TFB-10046 SS5]
MARDQSTDADDSVPHDLQVIVDAIEFEQKLSAFSIADVEAVNDALTERGERGRLKVFPYMPFTSTEFEKWMHTVCGVVRRIEAGELELTAALPEIPPIPTPARFGKSSIVFAYMDDFNKSSAAWLRTHEYFKKLLGMPRVVDRPLLPAFVPNAVPTFRGDPTAPSLSRDAHGFLTASAPEGLDGPSDASAPPIHRGYFNHSYVFMGKGEVAGGWEHDILFLSNVDYVLYPPPNELPTRRGDARYGPHEESRYGQWHEVGRYHMAFVPTCADGLVDELEHQELDGDMAWYNVDFSAHCSEPSKGRFLASVALRASLASDWNEAQDAYVRWGQIRRADVGMPQKAFMRGRQALGYLDHVLTRRQLLVAVAGYQRALQEIRGWNNYQQCRSEERDVQRFYEKRGAPFAPSVNLAQNKWQRKPYRGIFTWDENVAKRVAQFGVPVFFLVAFKRDQVLNPIWQRAEFVHPKCVTTLWEDLGEAGFMAGVQENRAQPIVDERGIGEDDEHPYEADDRYEEDEPAQPFIITEPQLLGEARTPAGVTSEPSHTIDRALREDGGRDGAPGIVAGHKRKAGEERAEDERGSKRAKSEAGKLRYPKTDDFPWPAYFPVPWEAARQAIQLVDGSDARYKMLYESEDNEWPMSEVLLHGRELLTPTLGVFARIKSEGYLSRMVASYAALRGEYIKEAATNSPDTAHRFSSAQWRQILKGYVPHPAHIAYGRALGVYVDDSEANQVEMVLAARETGGSQSAAEIRGAAQASSSSEADCSAHDTSAVPEKPLHFMDLDEQQTAEDDAREFEERVFARALPPAQRDLAPEMDRCEYEPDGWRLEGMGMVRSLDHFQWFVEEDDEVDFDEKDEEGRDEGRIINMRRAGKKSRRLDTHDYFWNYERGWVLGFELALDGLRSLVLGEWLTKRLRFFEDAGAQGKRKYKYDTQDKPMQLRVWQSRPMEERLALGYDPLGKVGFRTECPVKFHLSPENYELVYAGARAAGLVVAQQHRALEKQREADRREEDLAAAARNNAEEESRAGRRDSPRDGERDAESATTVPVGLSASTSGTGAGASAAFPQATVFKGKKPGKRGRKGKGKEHADEAGELMEIDVAPPNGWDLNKALTPDVFKFNEHELPRFTPPANDVPEFAGYVWPNASWRTFIIWDISELLFRFELYGLDFFLRKQYPAALELTRESTLERQQLIFDIWKGRNFLPSGPSPLTAEDWRVREPAVRAFGRIVKTWPRTALPEAPETFTPAGFTAYEKAVWLAYGQTYMDYHWREAPFPCRCPESLPF